ncbi:hypothetical protein [Anianabacter salinae]|uniref:hypothetical protein n=1 Tax=Anianabacter salinae TaxID=2851023 RepID=UPI00225E433E|nr:hypothetical protein [Anianabacter salinae]MBV0913266.1 hypothetical protein [Anianabacter salinae]
MKTAIIALAALTFAAPAFAQQIGSGTDAARQFFAQSETGNESRVFIDGMEGISDTALAQAERELKSQDGYNKGLMPMFNNDLGQYASEDARRILNNIAAEDDGAAS